MRLITFLRIASVVALCTSATIAAALEPPPPVFPPCEESMIHGNWVIIVESAAACIGTIAANGAVTLSNCPVFSFASPLTVHTSASQSSSCHVTGSIRYSSNYSFNVFLWLSADGSRLSGYLSGVTPPQVGTQFGIELVYVSK